MGPRRTYAHTLHVIDVSRIASTLAGPRAFFASFQPIRFAMKSGLRQSALKSECYGWIVRNWEPGKRTHVNRIWRVARDTEIKRSRWKSDKYVSLEFVTGGARPLSVEVGVGDICRMWLVPKRLRSCASLTVFASIDLPAG